jgi:hypothetical protein
MARGGLPVPDLNQSMLFLHLVGLTLGMASGWGNLVMGKLIADAQPGERPVLARFPPAIAKVGGVGLLLLWVTGFLLVFWKWNGFGGLPWQFHAKFTGVVLLTATIGVIHAHMAKARRGDMAAAKRLPVLGMTATLLSLTVVLFAVLAFD